MPHAVIILLKGLFKPYPKRIDTQELTCHDDLVMDWNTHANRNPRPAAALILYDDISKQVLLVRRNDRLQFMPGHHAFPGGAIRSDDDPSLVSGSESSSTKTALFAAVRETFEETGLLLAHGPLPDVSVLRQARHDLHREPSIFPAILRRFGLRIRGEDFQSAGVWITPTFSPIRFYTRYFLITYSGPHNQEVFEPDGEIVDFDWLCPAQARRQWHAGNLRLSTPIAYTLHHLARLQKQEATDLLSTPSGSRHDSLTVFEPRSGIHIFPLHTETLPPARFTNCVVIGEQALYIIDPGPVQPEEQRHLRALLERLQSLGGHVAAVLLTHDHLDHISAAPMIREVFGAPIWCHANTAALLPFTVDDFLNEGDIITVPGDLEWRIRCLLTPGHTTGHLCFLEETTATLICGDMAANPGPILIHPDFGGNMDAYLNSLERLLTEPFSFLVPAHGLPTFHSEAKDLVRQLLEHRLAREEKIRAALNEGVDSLETLLDHAYPDTSRELRPYARLQLRAHLIRLGRTLQ